MHPYPRLQIIKHPISFGISLGCNLHYEINYKVHTIFPFNHHLTMLLVFKFVPTRQDPLSRTPPAIPQKIIHFLLGRVPQGQGSIENIEEVHRPLLQTQNSQQVEEPLFGSFWFGYC